MGQVSTVEVQSTELVKEDQEIQNDSQVSANSCLSCVKQARLPAAESRGTSGTLGLTVVLRTFL